MTQSLYGPTVRSPEPSPPKFDDPGMVDPQDLDADGRRAWIAVADEASKDELLLRLMGENDALQKELSSERNAHKSTRYVLDEEMAIVNRIWSQLGDPSFDELRGRSIYDLIDELKAKAAP